MSENSEPMITKGRKGGRRLCFPPFSEKKKGEENRNESVHLVLGDCEEQYLGTAWRVEKKGGDGGRLFCRGEKKGRRREKDGYRETMFAMMLKNGRKS